jgi:hypothetical protein
MAMALWAMAAYALDTLDAGGKRYQGSFVNYRNSAFTFRTTEGETVRVLPSKVETLVLNPPARAVLVLQSWSKGENVLLKGYEKPVFRVEMDGQETTQSLTRVRSLVPAPSLDRGAVAEDDEEIISQGEEVDIGRSIHPGVATVVHFADQSNPSIKNGTYLGSLARESKGRMKVVKIVVPDMDAPVARQYQIVSMPQFWFYSRSGGLVRKLTERFAPVDVDGAVKQILK